MARKYIHLDLYTGDTSIMNPEEVAEFQENIQDPECDYYEEVQGVMTVYRSEEHMVLVVDMP